MVNFWAKILDEENKIVKQITIKKDKFVLSEVEKVINELCNLLDIPTPIILEKHLTNFNDFYSVIFKQDSFIELISFNKLVIECY